MTRMLKNLGDLGEGYARGYLKRKGYRVLFSPFRSKFGEIDIIARKDDLLIFLEVKTRRSLRFGSPLEAVNPAKQRHIIRAARFYLEKVNAVPFRKCRFDVLGITQVTPGKPPDIVHVEDAFRDDW
jgi:putative endonuclease